MELIKGFDLVAQLSRKGPRYDVDWGFFGDFMAGAPKSTQDRQRLLVDFAENELLLAGLEHPNLGRDEINHLAAERAVIGIDHAIERVTNKSVGLLQALSILAAVIAITFNDPEPGLEAWVGYGTLALTLWPTILLFANIGMTWRRGADYFNKPVAKLEDTYSLLLSRSHRLRSAQLLAFLCFVLVIVETILRAVWPTIFTQPPELPPLPTWPITWPWQ